MRRYSEFKFSYFGMSYFIKYFSMSVLIIHTPVCAKFFVQNVK